MSFFNATETSIQALWFNATAWANVADNAASSPRTQIACAGHTADPGEGGTLATSESAYTSYARVNVNRNSGGWTVSAGSVSPVANIEFPAATGGTESMSFGSVGHTGGGSAAGYQSGSISPAISITSGVTPRWTTSSASTVD